MNLGKNDQPTQSRPRSMGPARSCAASQWNRPAGVALVILGLRTHPADAPRAPPAVLQESAPEGSQGSVPDSARRAATHVQSAGKDSGEPGKVMALRMSSDEKEPAGLTLAWNAGVLKSSSVCCSPLVCLSSAEAAGVTQKCERRPSGIPELQGN